LYRFNISSDITDCREAELIQFPVAFSLSSAGVGAAMAAGAIGVEDIPLAFCGIIHRTGVHLDDVQSFPFFYL
jgi:hypothetical protein